MKSVLNFREFRAFFISKESKFKLNAPKINDINKKRCLY